MRDLKVFGTGAPVIRRTHYELNARAAELEKNDASITKNVSVEQSLAAIEFDKLTSMKVGSLKSVSRKGRYKNLDISKDIGDK